VGSLDGKNRSLIRKGARSAAARELWKINDIVGVYEGLLKADRKVWSDPCKHHLSQKVNMAPCYSISLRGLLRNFLGPCEVWCGGVEQREEIGTLSPSISNTFQSAPPMYTQWLFDGYSMRNAMWCRGETCKRARAHPRHASSFRCTITFAPASVIRRCA